jgi:SAM-dependent methyltransferase
VTTRAERERERDKRRYQRLLFDGVAERYQAVRPGYPGRVVESVITAAGLGPGAAVLEVGCGTGQLTERLARPGLRVTAIDIGASMIAAARRRVTSTDVSFQVTSFEDLDVADASFDLIISSAAFHWIDPEAVTAAGLFGAPSCLTDSQEATLAAGDVIALESTRATFLSWPQDTQRHFADELRQFLDPQPVMRLTRQTLVTMAPVRRDHG